MMRGITFKDPKSLVSFHTGRDWDLTMSVKSIGTPPLKSKLISLPDRDGDLDYTDALRGIPAYGSRKLEFVFEWMENLSKWDAVFTQIRNFIHGKRLIIVDPDDNRYYFMGRCEVSDPSGGLVKTFHVTVNADTWRYKNGGATIVERTVSTGDTITLANDWRPVVPTITTDKTVTIGFGGTSFSLSGAGSFKLPKIMFTYGSNEISIVEGESVTLRFEYTEGAL